MRRTANTIGRRFQEETKYARSLRGGIPAPPLSRGGQKTIPLEKVLMDKTPALWELLSRRRSVRNYALAPLSAGEISRLIWAAQGVTQAADSPSYRTAPSAGALHPIDTYLIVNRVEGLEPGIYFLNVPAFALEMRNRGDFSPRIAAAALEQPAVKEAAVIFLWAAVIHRCAQKYRERAYRYIYLDCGHICQNVYLAATAMDLGCCGIAAFFDDEVNAILGVDGQEETVIYLAAVGKKRGEQGSSGRDRT